MNRKITANGIEYCTSLMSVMSLMYENDEALFLFASMIGKELMDTHLNYETIKPYPLKRIITPSVPLSYRVEKIHISKDRRSIKVNESLTLAEIPLSAHQYQLGNKSAIEWIVDQYQVSTDKRSGIVSDPNNENDPEYIVLLICRVVQVSLRTIMFQRMLDRHITQDMFVGVEKEMTKNAWESEKKGE